jgi:hypothetical protein
MRTTVLAPSSIDFEENALYRDMSRPNGKFLKRSCATCVGSAANLASYKESTT